MLYRYFLAWNSKYLPFNCDEKFHNKSSHRNLKPSITFFRDLYVDVFRYVEGISNYKIVLISLLICLNAWLSHSSEVLHFDLKISQKSLVGRFHRAQTSYLWRVKYQISFVCFSKCKKCFFLKVEHTLPCWKTVSVAQHLSFPRCVGSSGQHNQGGVMNFQLGLKGSN